MMPCTASHTRTILLAAATALVTTACDGASPAADTGTTVDSVAAPAESPSVNSTPSLAPPDFADGTINSVAFEGGYACDPGFAPEITFQDDGSSKVFAAYLHERLLTSGTWSWDGTTLRIESPAGSFAFTDVAIGDGTLVLGRGDERWACRHL